VILASDIEHARWGAKALGRHGYTALGKAVERLATFAAYAKSAPTKTPDKAVEIPKAPPKRRSRDAEPTRLEIDDSSRGHETWFLENARDKAIEHFGWDVEKWRWICGTGRSYEVAEYRSKAAIYLRNECKLSMPQIAKIMRGRYGAHATVYKWLGRGTK
jgi:hypothetical protein